jgi:FMN phosphatase YigB (HAD superfamily)
MAKYPLLGLDLDGVILDHTEMKRALARKYGLSVSRRETSSDVFNELVSDDAKATIQHVLYDDQRHAFRAPFLRGAVRGLTELKRRGHPFVLISRRKDARMARRVLKAKGLWGPFFDARNTFFVERKKDKDRMAKKLGVRLYIDDQPSVLADLASVRRRFLMDPYGAYPDDTSYRRVASWREFLDALR